MSNTFALWAASGSPKVTMPGPFVARKFSSAQLGADAWVLPIEVAWQKMGAGRYLWCGATLNQGTNSQSLKRLRSVLIDNANCTAPVFLQIPSSGQVVRCAAGQVLSAALISSDQEFILYRGARNSYAFLASNPDQTTIFFADETLPDVQGRDMAVSEILFSAGVNAGVSGTQDFYVRGSGYYVTSIVVNIWQLTTTAVGGSVRLRMGEELDTFYDTYTMGPISGNNYNVRNEMLFVNYLAPRALQQGHMVLSWTMNNASVFAANILVYGQVIP